MQSFEDILKQLASITDFEIGSGGTASNIAGSNHISGISGYSGSYGSSGYSGYRRDFSEQEMIDSFLAGYKLMMLIDEDIKPEIIDMAKNHVKNLLNKPL